MNEVFQRRVGVGGERLLKHRHAEVRQQLAARRQPLAVPGFIGIDNQRPAAPPGE
jgi:hypothetical protein